MAEHIISVPTVAALKAQAGNTENSVMTLGSLVKGDGGGALYFFDSTDTTSIEDTLYWNIVVPSNNIGRWKKIFVRTLVLPQGVLTMNGGVKTLYVQTMTDASGNATVNLTTNNTATGTPIFTALWWDDSKSAIATTNVNDAIGSTRRSLSADLKVLSHMFYRGNSSTVSILGANVLGFRSAPASSAVNFIIVGV